MRCLRRNIYVVILIDEQLAGQALPSKAGMPFRPGKGGHLIVFRDGRQSVLPVHGAGKEISRPLWLAILKQLGIEKD